MIREAILPCQAKEHEWDDDGDHFAAYCPGANDRTRRTPHEGATVVKLKLVYQHELWQIATAGTAGDGSEPLPEFWVSEGHLP